MGDGNKLRALPAALIVMALMIAPAAADTRKGGGDVGIDLGLISFDSDVTDNTGVHLGIRAGYMATDLFQIEGQFGWSTHNDVDLVTGFANGVFNFRSGRRVMPYFLVGVGGARLDLGDLDDTGIAVQTAGGVKTFGEKGRVGLRLELGAMGIDTFDDETVHWTLSGGFVFDLGSHHYHPPKQR